MQSQFLRVSEFCELYAVSRATFYRLVKRGDLPICKIGSATRVRSTDAEQWFCSLSSVQ
ncbi:MAG: DNA-binding protein [Sphingomonadales bacterium CG12_big_fil_rev_8_21_14_0_65_65_10]|nr:MAG: DNA-binding protein [Sphingomonadales bacterium CG12_big_fil_rev_8_21_14_0_65_65_10]